MKHDPTNPFTIGVLPRPGEMADRVTELDRIARALSDAGSKLIVYGDRRLGQIRHPRVRGSEGPRDRPTESLSTVDRLRAGRRGQPDPVRRARRDRHPVA